MGLTQACWATWINSNPTLAKGGCMCTCACGLHPLVKPLCTCMKGSTYTWTVVPQPIQYGICITQVLNPSVCVQCCCNCTILHSRYNIGKLNNMYVAMYVITMSNVYGCVCLSDTMLAALILMGLLWLAFDLPPSPPKC